MSKPNVVKRPVRAAKEEGNNLAGAVETLFGSADAPVLLRSGKTVVVQQGKVRHLGLLLEFFNVLVSRMDRQQITTLVALYEDRKKAEEFKKKVSAALQAGETLPDAPEQSTESLVDKAFDRSALLLTLLNCVNDVLPKIISGMSNVTAEEFDDLDLDEGAAVAYAVFTVNYGFFSRNLPQALQLSLGAAARKMAGK